MTAPGASRGVSQIDTMSGAHPTMTGRPSEEATTLSSAASALGVDTLAVSRRSYKGVFIGALVVAAVAGGGVLITKQRRPPPAVATPAPAVVERPAPEPPRPAPPQQVDIRFESEPDGAHVLRKVDGKDPPEDLGVAPLDLKLDKSDRNTEYLLRADGYQDRAVTIDASRDRVLHLALDRQPPPPEKKVAKPTPARPARPRKPIIHDADGLAVPSF
jgi:hypothetical protein